jgi:hypothetical protein
VGEDIAPAVVEEACRLAVVASVPYSVKTSVGHWEAAYQADSASVAYTVQAYRHQAAQEEASWVVQDMRKGTAHKHNHVRQLEPPNPLRTREEAWGVDQEAPCGAIAEEDCVVEEGITECIACHCTAT